MPPISNTPPPSGATRTRLVVVDEQGVIRGFFRETLGRREDYEIVGEGRTGLDALRLCQEFKPHVLIMELMLRETGAATVVAELRAQGLPTHTLIFTGSRNEAALLDALRMHPHGIVHKDESLPALWDALRTVARGGCAISPSLAELNERALREGPGVELSPRERTVLQMVAEGLSSKAIAQRLELSPKTVEHHRASIMDKLNVHDIPTLTRLALQMGLVE